jgi:hypothetical protein
MMGEILAGNLALNALCMMPTMGSNINITNTSQPREDARAGSRTLYHYASLPLIEVVPCGSNSFCTSAAELDERSKRRFRSRSSSNA